MFNAGNETSVKKNKPPKNGISIPWGKSVAKMKSRSLLLPLLFNALILNQNTQWDLETQHPVLEKTLMPGKIEDRRRRGLQKRRWLDGIINSTDMSLNKHQEIVKDREAWHAVVHGIAKIWTWLNDWTITSSNTQRTGGNANPPGKNQVPGPGTGLGHCKWLSAEKGSRVLPAGYGTVRGSLGLISKRLRAIGGKGHLSQNLCLATEQGRRNQEICFLENGTSLDSLLLFSHL